MLLGGFGFLSRLRGLSVDNLVEAEVVLADGSIIIVNEKEYPGTLVIRPPPYTGDMY
jgi:FAD/FMN-containing dehydrogenase